MLRFHIVTLFPSYFESALRTGLMARGIEGGIIHVDFIDPREFSTERHRHVDDSPYGGGPGMVIQAKPVADALRSIPTPGRMLCMAPNGRAASQPLMRELSGESDITILCGRYEGFDARIFELFDMEPLGVGNVVLNGGECAALAVVEAVARLLPGFMGKEESGEEESFSNGLLEYPHFTRPASFEGIDVPSVLQNGNHEAIRRWRREESLATTLARRPELLDDAPLTLEDARALASLSRRSCAGNMSFALVHYPVLLGERSCGTSSVTNLDMHDISRITKTYGMGTFYLVTPVEEQRELLGAVLRHWERSGERGHADRLQALRCAAPVESIEAAVDDMQRRYGERPFVVASSAVWAKKLVPITCSEVRERARRRPVLLLLGTAKGLAPEALALCDATVRPLRFCSYNHLSVRSAAAVLADRIIGDFF